MSGFPKYPTAKRPAPLSIRLTAEERQRLERLAGTMSLAAYIKMTALEGVCVKRMPQRTQADQKLLAKVLAALGASQLSSSLERLSYAAKNGTLYVDDRLVSRFSAACDDIYAMRIHVMEALGKKLPSGDTRAQRVSIQFAQAAYKGDDLP